MTSTATISPTENDWKTALCAGDVVVYIWPLIDPAPGETPKRRPTLVHAVREIDGRLHAELVFGTGRLRRRGPRDVILDDPGDLRHAGIRKPTRFEFERRLLVPLDDTGFAVSAALGTPVIGRMPAPCPRGPQRFHLRRRRGRARPPAASL